ncbi:MAG: nitrous oxide-stimulated promoter family protein [Candidatus Coproplasma sp.]
MDEKRKFKAWEKEKKLIPAMIKKYCHGKHKTKGKEVCAECKELTDYALFRLDKCPFKENKKFCSFCKIHCYKPDMREKIKAVMKYSGPRLIFTHPIFAISHVVQTVKYKRALKKEVKNDR